jgi:glycosyltransferase involved in cell wall biosynthesis
MHILIIPSEQFVPPDNPLAGIFQHHLALALKRAGYKVGVISPQLRSALLLRTKLFGWPRGITSDDDNGVPVLRYHGWYLPTRLTRGDYWLWLRAGMLLFEKYAAEHGMPDIVHAHNALNAGVLAARLKKRFAVPYVLTEHSSFYARGLIRNAEIPLAKDAFRNADARLVVSPALGHDVGKCIGDYARSWEWVPNILDEKFEKTNIVKDRHGDQFHFLNVGSLIDIKGHADLLHAFASRFRGIKDVRLCIAGDGPLKGKLELLSSRLGVDHEVVFLGQLKHERVLAEMQSSDVYVHSSHYETFGVVLIEALACGKPVISTACGGPECIVTDGNGMLAPVKDFATLGEAMEKMRKNIGNYDPVRIREDCISRFGEQKIVGYLSVIYNRICRRKQEINFEKRHMDI